MIEVKLINSRLIQYLTVTVTNLFIWLMKAINYEGTK